jgi:hypothetical protein
MTIGVETGDGYLKSIYFKNPSGSKEADRWKQFPVSNLAYPQAIISQYGIDFVRLALQNRVLIVSYKDDYKFGSWHTKKLALICKDNNTSCGLFDPNTKSQVRSGFVKVATGWAGPVGIADISVK